MTSYDKVFSRFTSKIKDYDLAVTEPDLVDLDLIQLMNNSIFYFRYPKINLTKKNDEERFFEEDLTYDEIAVLSILMVREWFKRFIYNTDVTIQTYGDTDFEVKSQANHLRQLASAYLEIVNAEVKKALDLYSRSSNGEVFDYSKFVGKK